MELTEEENQTLQFLASDKNSVDLHPDAHACRLKISLVLLDSPVSVPWDLTTEMQRYIRKLTHVSAGCRLSHDEELMLLKHCVCDSADNKFNPKIHTVFGVTINKTRRSQLHAKAAGKDQCSIEVPPMPKGVAPSNSFGSLGLATFSRACSSGSFPSYASLPRL